RLAPTAETLATTDPSELAALGIVASRARCIVSLAMEVAAGRIRLDPDSDVATTIERLMAVRGIGPWTAQYIAMRALADPDAFPKEDVMLRRSLGEEDATRADAHSLTWRPW